MATSPHILLQDRRDDDEDYDVSFRRLEGEDIPVSAPPWQQMYWNRKPDYSRLEIASLQNMTTEMFRRYIGPVLAMKISSTRSALHSCVTSTSLEWIKGSKPEELD